MALSEDGRRLFVSVVTGSRVAVIDTEVRKIIATIPTGSRPHGIKISPDNKYIFIGEMKGKGITVADAQNLKIVDRIVFDEGVRPFEFTDDGLLYLQLSNFHGFIEYDVKGKRPLKKVYLPETERSRLYGGKYPKDAAHHGLSVSPDEKYICIAGTASDYVALISRSKLSVDSIISVGEQPSWAVHGLDGRFCYVSSRGSNTVSVISYSSKSETKRISVGDYPQRMLVAKVPMPCTQ